jgi:hypothetical protein
MTKLIQHPFIFFNLYIESLLCSLKPTEADLRTSRVGRQQWQRERERERGRETERQSVCVYIGREKTIRRVAKLSEILWKSSLSLFHDLSPTFFFTLRPALPEKKVADLSTLNEVGYQIRI